MRALTGRRIVVGAAFGWMIAPLHAAPLEALAKKLAAGAVSLENKKIAVLTFPYHDEKISSGSTLVSERLTTCLVQRKEVRVLERNLLGQLLKEKRLAETGVIDPRSLKAIGKILDSDAIVTGTLIDLPNNRTEINARLIRTDTGEVLSAGRAVIERTWTDVPCEIVVRRSPVANPRAASSLEQEADVSVVTPSLPGKSLKLSNENFPPGHRLYLPNESLPPVAKNPPGSYWAPGMPKRSSPYQDGSASSYGDYPLTSRSDPLYYRPALSSQGGGYNGTDGKRLRRVHLRPHYPLGTIHTERRTIPTPPTSDSAK